MGSDSDREEETDEVGAVGGAELEEEGELLAGTVGVVWAEDFGVPDSTWIVGWFFA